MGLGELLVRADAVFQASASYLNAIVIALVILFAGFIIARIVGTALARLFTWAQLDDLLAKALGKRRHYARSIRTFIVRSLYIITVFLALASLRLAGVALVLLAGIVVLIVLVSLVLAAVEIIPNILARSRLEARHIHVGDEVEIDHPSGRIAGRITDMTLIDLQLKRPGGDVVFFPNSSLLGVRITKRRK